MAMRWREMALLVVCALCLVKVNGDADEDTPSESEGRLTGRNLLQTNGWNYVEYTGQPNRVRLDYYVNSAYPVIVTTSSYANIYTVVTSDLISWPKVTGWKACSCENAVQCPVDESTYNLCYDKAFSQDLRQKSLLFFFSGASYGNNITVYFWVGPVNSRRRLLLSGPKFGSHNGGPQAPSTSTAGYFGRVDKYFDRVDTVTELSLTYLDLFFYDSDGVSAPQSPLSNSSPLSNAGERTASTARALHVLVVLALGALVL